MPPPPHLAGLAVEHHLHLAQRAELAELLLEVPSIQVTTLDLRALALDKPSTLTLQTGNKPWPWKVDMTRPCKLAI